MINSMPFVFRKGTEKKSIQEYRGCFIAGFLAVAAFWLAFSHGKFDTVLSWGDGHQSVWPAHYLIANGTDSAGYNIWWDAHTGFGSPFLTDGVTHVILYPFTYLWKLFSPAAATNSYILIHVFFCSIGVFLLARRYGCEEKTSILASFIYPLGFYFYGSHQPPTLAGCTWLPYMLYLAKSTTFKTYPAKWFSICLLWSFAFFGAGPQIGHMMWIAVLGLVFFEVMRKKKSSIELAWGIIAMLTAYLIVSFIIIPMYFQSKMCTRTPTLDTEWWGFSYFFHMIIKIYNNFLSPWHESRYAPYIGWGTVCMGAVGTYISIIKKKYRHFLPLTGVLIVFVLFSLNNANPFLFITGRDPILSFVQYGGERYVAFWTLPLAIFAAQALTLFQDHPRLRFIVSAAFFFPLLPSLIGKYLGHDLGKYLGNHLGNYLSNYLAINFNLGLFVGIVLIWIFAVHNHKLAFYLALLAIFLEVSFFGGYAIGPVKKADFLTWYKQPEWDPRNPSDQTEDLYRLGFMKQTISYPMKRRFSLREHDISNQYSEPRNSAIPNRFRTAGTASSFKPAFIADIITRQWNAYFVMDFTPIVGKAIENAMSIRYWLSQDSTTSYPEYYKVKYEDKGLRVLYNPLALPRIRLVGAAEFLEPDEMKTRLHEDALQSSLSLHNVTNTAYLEKTPELTDLNMWNALRSDPSASVKIIEENDDRLVCTTSAKYDQMLVLSEMWYPGWTCYIDGKEAKIWRTYGFMRAVHVPAGTHTVSFDYLPKGFMTGVFLSLTGFLIIIILISMSHLPWGQSNIFRDIANKSDH